MFMIISDRYIIKRHVSHAWYGCWTIKALVEAEVFDGFTVICGGIAAPLIIASLYCVSIFIKVIRLAKKPILKAKMVY
jgi:hypothetical protein